MAKLEQERQLSPLPPVVVGDALIVPIGLLERERDQSAEPATFAHETKEIERLAMEAVMKQERAPGFDPRDVSKENLGYDIEWKDPRTGRLRFLEVKGRVAGAVTITVTRNEMPCALNSPDQWRLAIVIEIFRQRQIYQLLTDAAAETGNQIIAASHSEVLLNEAGDRDVVIAFVGKPHRIDDRGQQRMD